VEGSGEEGGGGAGGGGVVGGGRGVWCWVVSLVEEPCGVGRKAGGGSVGARSVLYAE